jgi:hypothetical protein
MLIEPLCSQNPKYLAEVAEILAAGLMRALARKSSGNGRSTGESSLDFSAIKSGHPTPDRAGESGD